MCIAQAEMFDIGLMGAQMRKPPSDPPGTYHREARILQVVRLIVVEILYARLTRNGLKKMVIK